MGGPLWSPPFSFLLKREDNFPVVLHVYHCPPLGLGLIKRLVQLPDGGLSVIGPFTLGIGVMHIESEARS